MKKRILAAPGLIALGAALWSFSFLIFGSACAPLVLFLTFLACLPLALGFDWARRELNPVVALISGLLILAGLRTRFLLSLETTFSGPSSCLAGLASPFFLLSFVLILSALLISLSCSRTLSPQQNVQAAPSGQKSGSRIDLLLLPFAFLILAKTIHTFYWLTVWDNTGDSLGYLWLYPLIITALFSGVMLLITLPRRIKWSGPVYSIVVVALLAGASTLAQRVDYHRLTEARAERLTTAIDAYSVRTGSYPAGLGQLVPWYTLSILEPVIIPGLTWCYQGSQHAYRLAYVSRSHWSDPNLFGVVYKTAGDVSQLQPVCAQEISAFQFR